MKTNIDGLEDTINDHLETHETQRYFFNNEPEQNNTHICITSKF